MASWGLPFVFFSSTAWTIVSWDVNHIAMGCKLPEGISSNIYIYMEKSNMFQIWFHNYSYEKWISCSKQTTNQMWSEMCLVNLWSNHIYIVHGLEKCGLFDLFGRVTPIASFHWCHGEVIANAARRIHRFTTK